MSWATTRAAAVGTNRDSRLRERVHRGLARGVLLLIESKSWAGRGSGGA